MGHSIKLKLTFFLLVPLVALCEPQVPCLFIFGDSIVDNGNNNNLQTTSKANFLPYGIDFPDGPTGRFTNGRNIADIIAELLGFEDHIPAFANAIKEDILRGVNYGSGGAGILDETGTTFGEVISLNRQLLNHETVVSRITEMLGDEGKAQEHLSSCIYSVGMGNNDYLVNYLPQFYSTTKYNPPEYAALLISQYSDQLKKLYQTGARKIAVFQLGRLGCVPAEIARHGSSDGSICAENTNRVVEFFNVNLKVLIDDLNNQFPNAHFVYIRGISNATSYDGIRVMDQPCCQVVAGDLCAAGSAPCRNRDEYLFWDEVHTTEAAHSIAAGAAYRDMAPLYSLSLPSAVW